MAYLFGDLTDFVSLCFLDTNSEHYKRDHLVVINGRYNSTFKLLVYVYQKE